VVDLRSDHLVPRKESQIGLIVRLSVSEKPQTEEKFKIMTRADCLWQSMSCSVLLYWDETMCMWKCGF
jgi:hypothetical protein